MEGVGGAGSARIAWGVRRGARAILPSTILVLALAIFCTAGASSPIMLTSGMTLEFSFVSTANGGEGNGEDSFAYLPDSGSHARRSQHGQGVCATGFAQRGSQREVPAAGWGRVPHFYYPEWRASLAPGGVPLPIRPAAEDGLIEIQLEAGRRNIALTLEPSLAEKLGWSLSGFSVLVLGFLLLRLRRFHESSGA